MADKKIIAVIGATGAQGGGLVRAMMADKSGSFRPRALTRNINSEKAKALAAAGAEVVAADTDKPGTVERAFAGAYGAFCVTNFWEHFSPERELTQAGNMARAAKAAGLEHVSGAEMAAALTRALGQDVRYNAVAPEVYRGFGFPGAADLGNMFQFKRDFNDYYRKVRDVDFARALNPELQTFGHWLARHKDQIPLE